MKTQVFELSDLTSDNAIIELNDLNFDNVIVEFNDLEFDTSTIELSHLVLDNVIVDPVEKYVSKRPIFKGHNFNREKLVQINPHRIEFQASKTPAIIAIGLSCAFLLFVFLAKMENISQWDISSASDFIYLLHLIIIFVAAFIFIGYFSKPIVFDKRLGLFWEGRKSPEYKINLRSSKHFIPLENIHSLQILRKYLGRGKSDNHLYYELNLVLKNRNRINLAANQFQLNKILKQTEILSQFLNKPVSYYIGNRHKQLKPKLVKFKACDKSGSAKVKEVFPLHLRSSEPRSYYRFMFFIILPLIIIFGIYLSRVPYQQVEQGTIVVIPGNDKGNYKIYYPNEKAPMRGEHHIIQTRGLKVDCQSKVYIDQEKYMLKYSIDYVVEDPVIAVNNYGFKNFHQKSGTGFAGICANCEEEAIRLAKEQLILNDEQEPVSTMQLKWIREDEKEYTHQLLGLVSQSTGVKLEKILVNQIQRLD